MSIPFHALSVSWLKDWWDERPDAGPKTRPQTSGSGDPVARGADAGARQPGVTCRHMVCHRVLAWGRDPAANNVPFMFDFREAARQPEEQSDRACA